MSDENVGEGAKMRKSGAGSNTSESAGVDAILDTDRSDKAYQTRGLSTARVSDLLGIGPATVGVYARAGKIRRRIFGRQAKFLPEDVIEFLLFTSWVHYKPKAGSNAATAIAFGNAARENCSLSCKAVRDLKASLTRVSAQADAAGRARDEIKEKYNRLSKQITTTRR